MFGFDDFRSGLMGGQGGLPQSTLNWMSGLTANRSSDEAMARGADAAASNPGFAKLSELAMNRSNMPAPNAEYGTLMGSGAAMPPPNQLPPQSPDMDAARKMLDKLRASGGEGRGAGFKQLFDLATRRSEMPMPSSQYGTLMGMDAATSPQVSPMAGGLASLLGSRMKPPVSSLMPFLGGDQVNPMPKPYLMDYVSSGLDSSLVRNPSDQINPMPFPAPDVSGGVDGGGFISKPMPFTMVEDFQTKPMRVPDQAGGMAPFDRLLQERTGGMDGMTPFNRLLQERTGGRGRSFMNNRMRLPPSTMGWLQSLMKRAG